MMLHPQRDGGGSRLTKAPTTSLSRPLSRRNRQSPARFPFFGSIPFRAELPQASSGSVLLSQATVAWLGALLRFGAASELLPRAGWVRWKRAQREAEANTGGGRCGASKLETVEALVVSELIIAMISRVFWSA
eukprot:146128-Prymnesium_polylepis.1